MRTNRARLAEWVSDIIADADCLTASEWVDRIYFDINHGIITKDADV